MEAGEIDIVIGTQLVTKGYHFPNLTLVGVVDADLGLSGGDLRAAERTFQQIQQVAGRAGRGDKPGRVLVQTHDPEAPVIQALVTGDAEGFYAAETDARREAAMPPFGRLAAIIVSSEKPGRGDRDRAADRPRRAARTRTWRCSAPPLPRSPCCAAATACACSSTPPAAVPVQDIIRDWLGALTMEARASASASTSIPIPFSRPVLSRAP